MRRRLLTNGGGCEPTVLHVERFYPAGTYYWTVPSGTTSVDVFLVGGGAGGRRASGQYKAGSGGGYTKTYRGSGYVAPSNGTTWVGSYYDGRDGDAIEVTPGESIEIIVGAGGSYNSNGGYSQFKNSNFRAEGGYCGTSSSTSGLYGASGGNGGSGGGANNCDGGIDGDDGYYYRNDPQYERGNCGSGQGHTTRDFGEPDGTPNAAGSMGDSASNYIRDKEGYAEGAGYSNPNSGYGGAGWSIDSASTIGGDGTVLIRYYACE